MGMIKMTKRWCVLPVKDQVQIGKSTTYHLPHIYNFTVTVIQFNPTTVTPT